jgi:hypothetical protein
MTLPRPTVFNHTIFWQIETFETVPLRHQSNSYFLSFTSTGDRGFPGETRPGVRRHSHGEPQSLQQGDHHQQASAVYYDTGRAEAGSEGGRASCVW